MEYRAIHPQFKETFVFFGSVPDAIQEGLWNYMAYGIPGGSFLSTVLVNNFIDAVIRADHTWTGRSFSDLAKWLIHHAPDESFGSAAKVEAWTRKTHEERRDIMIELGLRPHEFDILAGRAIP